MKILLTGADGFLGKKLFKALREDKSHEVIGTSRKASRDDVQFMDVTYKENVEYFFRDIKPDLLVHSAALVDVDRCERERQLAYAVNADSVRTLASLCGENRARMIYFSTDYVFDGNSNGFYDVNSKTNPINYYGVTKLEGERAVSSLLENFAIVRPTIMYGFNDFDDKKSFVLSVVDKLKNGQRVVLDNHRIKYPVLIDDVAKRTMDLIATGSVGIHHISGPYAITKYDWGRKIAKTFGLDEGLIEGRDLNETNRPYNVLFGADSMIGVRRLKEGLELIKKQMEENRR